MELREDVVYITNAEKELIEKSMKTDVLIPHVYLRSYLQSQLNEEYEMTNCRQALEQYKHGKYKIVD